MTVAIGSEGSEGWRAVRHWLSQTPSIRPAHAQARSLSVGAVAQRHVEVVQGALEDLLQPLQPLDVLRDAGLADPLAP